MSPPDRCQKSNSIWRRARMQALVAALAGRRAEEQRTGVAAGLQFVAPLKTAENQKSLVRVSGPCYPGLTNPKPGVATRGMQPQAGFFKSTRWSIVLRAGQPDVLGSEGALGNRCEDYRPPLPVCPGLVAPARARVKQVEAILIS